VDFVWIVLVGGGMAFAIMNGRADAAVQEALRSASAAVETVLQFTGAMCLWLGLTKIAERAGLPKALARTLSPLIRPLFPSLPRGHEALSAITMSLAANLLGLGSAATPFGLRAMEELRRLAPRGDEASDAMCTFVVMACAGFCAVPSTMVALRAQMGSRDPSAVVGPTLTAGLAALCAVLVADVVLRRTRKG